MRRIYFNNNESTDSHGYNSFILTSFKDKTFLISIKSIIEIFAT